MDHLKGLRLDPCDFSWVKPFQFNDDDRKRLRCWLSESQIDNLEEEAGFGLSVDVDKRHEPDRSDEKKVLIKIQKLASALAVALKRAPPGAGATLDLVAHKYLGGTHQKKRLTIELGLFASGLKVKVSSIPKQVNQKPKYVNSVSQIAAVLEPLGIKASSSKTTRFYKITQIVFDAAKIPGDQSRSIKAFIKAQGGG